MALFFNQGQNPISNFLGDGQNQTPYNNSGALMSLGLGLLSGRNPTEQVGQAASNFANDRQSGKMTNQTVKFLQTANPQLAEAVQSGALSAADAYKLHFASQAKNKTFQKLDDGTYGFADESTGTFNPLGKATKPLGSGADGTGNFGLNPIWGTKDGKPMLFQPGKDGNVNQMQFPEGFVPSPGFNNLDTSTAIIPQNKRTGDLGTPIAKDVAGKSNQEALGAGQGAAAVALPQAIQLAGLVDKQVQTLKADPALPNVLGSFDSRTPNLFPSSVAVQSKIDQLKGGTFLQARQMLKGGGSITDYEGQRADAAQARMNQAQSVEDFNAALDDYNSAVQDGVKKLQAMANGNFGVQPQGGQTQPPPNAGVTSSGIKFSVVPQ